MSTHLSRLRWALTACCAAALTFATAAEAARKVAGDLRVVTDNGQTLVEQRQYTGTTKVPTSPKADCFGDGTGGSGNKVRVPGPTALGIVKHAALSQRRLRPLLLTDAFDFGIGICGFGGAVAPQSGFWYLKTNHVGSSAGGDGTRVRRGDDVLWYLIDDFNQPTPVELELRAPARVRKGHSFTVKAFQYADDGTRSPAAGVRLKGLGEVTGADGTAQVSPDGPFTRLRGFRDGAIPSNTLEVCSLRRLRECPRDHVTRIVGTDNRDRVRSTRGPDVISTLGGRDRIDIRRSRNSAPPIVKCGTGRDKLIARRHQRFTARRSCEKIRRRRG